MTTCITNATTVFSIYILLLDDITSGLIYLQLSFLIAVKVNLSEPVAVVCFVGAHIPCNVVTMTAVCYSS